MYILSVRPWKCQERFFSIMENIIVDLMEICKTLQIFLINLTFFGKCAY